MINNTSDTLFTNTLIDNYIRTMDREMFDFLRKNPSLEELERIDHQLPFPKDETTFELVKVLNHLLECNTDSVNIGTNNNIPVVNAKVKRRIKRMLLRIDPDDAILNEIKQQKELKSDTNVSLIEPKVAISWLKDVSSMKMIENILNRLIGPDQDSKNHTDWIQLKLEFYKLLENKKYLNMINKNIKRRILRLIYVLSTDQERDDFNTKKKEFTKVTAVIDKPSTHHKLAIATEYQHKERSHNLQANASISVVHVTNKSLSNCLEEVMNAKSSDDLDSAITNVSTLSEGASDGGDIQIKLLNQLNCVLLDDTMVSHAKIRRKVLRLIKVLSPTEECSENHPVGNIVSNNIDDFVQQDPPISHSSNNNSSNIGTSSINTSISTSSNSDNKTTSIIGESSSEVNILDQLLTVKTAQQLDNVLSKVDLRTISTSSSNEITTCSTIDYDVNNKTQEEFRRQFKRTLDELLTNDEISSNINAKIRRKIIRISTALQSPDDGQEETKLNEVTNNVKVDLHQTTTSMDQVNNKSTKVPYVLFIGNLPYDTTSQDIEKFLRVNKAITIDSEIKVRLRANATTGESLGIAFVEVESVQELHQCIALHHSVYDGRIINIEKSCGGRNKTQRVQKINERRSVQRIKVESAVDKVLLHYQQKGVLHNVHKWGQTMKDKFYSFSPTYISDVIYYIL